MRSRSLGVLCLTLLWSPSLMPLTGLVTMDYVKYLVLISTTNKGIPLTPLGLAVRVKLKRLKMRFGKFSKFCSLNKRAVENGSGNLNKRLIDVYTEVISPLPHPPLRFTFVRC